MATTGNKPVSTVPGFQVIRPTPQPVTYRRVFSLMEVKEALLDFMTKAGHQVPAGHMRLTTLTSAGSSPDNPKSVGATIEILVDS